MATINIAYAADNSTEFGVEDDLWVGGTGGSGADPDVEIKGFTVFGSTQTTYPGPVTTGPGNVVVNGYLAVSSGMYVNDSSTFTQRVEIQGYGVLNSTVQFMNNTGSLTNLYFNNGAANAGKVLKASANGFLTWENDLNPVMTFATPLRLQMVNATDTNLTDSLFLQNAAATNITMVSGSSMTILGDGTDGLGVSGTAKFNGNVNLGDEAGDLVTAVGAVTAQNGLSVIGGNASVANDLTVTGNTTLGNGDDTVTINGAATGQFAVFKSGADTVAWMRKK